jgi:hypothetical protein
LRSLPGDATAPFLVVAENDVETSLTTEEIRRIETEPYPYAVIRPVSGRPIGALLSGTTIHAVTRDVYLEHRNAPGRETLQKLRNQVQRAVKLVDEFETGWPLATRFELQNDLGIYSDPNDPKTLYCTLRYSATYYMSLKEMING